MVTRLDSVTPDQWRAMVASGGSRGRGVSGPLLDMLRTSAGHFVFEADHLTHQLQTATRAYLDDADDEVVVAALLHDVAEVVAPRNHAAVAAEMLRPYVRDDVFHLVRTHSDFQGRYYNEYIGLDPDAFRRHATEPWYDLAVTFSDRWDQASFDPAYPTKPLTFFEPVVRRVFGETAPERPL